MKLRLPVILILFFGLVFHAFADLQKGYDAYFNKDYATALKEWKPVAEQGDAEAQYRLSLMIIEKADTEVMQRLSIFWMKQAAENGNTEARELMEENKDSSKQSELLADT